jgi:hypothetical protein
MTLLDIRPGPTHGARVPQVALFYLGGCFVFTAKVAQCFFLPRFLRRLHFSTFNYRLLTSVGSFSFPFSNFYFLVSSANAAYNFALRKSRLASQAPSLFNLQLSTVNLCGVLPFSNFYFLVSSANAAYNFALRKSDKHPIRRRRQGCGIRGGAVFTLLPFLISSF